MIQAALTPALAILGDHATVARVQRPERSMRRLVSVR